MEHLSEAAARAADEALRTKAEAMEVLARKMDDQRASQTGYHINSLEWMEKTAPQLRDDAEALRIVGRSLLVEALK